MKMPDQNIEPVKVRYSNNSGDPAIKSFKDLVDAEGSLSSEQKQHILQRTHALKPYSKNCDMEDLKTIFFGYNPISASVLQNNNEFFRKLQGIIGCVNIS